MPSCRSPEVCRAERVTLHRHRAGPGRLDTQHRLLCLRLRHHTDAFKQGAFHLGRRIRGETREGVADLPASRRRRAPAGGLGRRAGHASLVFQQVAWSSPTRASCEDRRAVTMHFAALAGVGSSSRIRSGMSVANVRVVDESAALAETGLALRGRVVTPSEAHVARRFPFRPCPRTLPSRPLLARGGRPGHGDARACYGPRRRTSGAPRGAGSDLARVMKDRTSVGPGEEGDGARGGDRC